MVVSDEGKTLGFFIKGNPTHDGAQVEGWEIVGVGRNRGQDGARTRHQGKSGFDDFDKSQILD